MKVGPLQRQILAIQRPILAIFGTFTGTNFQKFFPFLCFWHALERSTFYCVLGTFRETRKGEKWLEMSLKFVSSEHLLNDMESGLARPSSSHNPSIA